MKNTSIFITPKKLFLLVFMLGLYLTNHAQNQQGAWTSAFASDSISVKYQFSSCDGKEVVYLQIENNSSSEATINWSLWGEATPKTIKVAASLTTSGGCSSRSNWQLSDIIPEGKTKEDISPLITLNN